MKGKLIVICGTDGSGKGTQTEILIKRLREGKLEVEKTDFPQYNKQSSFLVQEYLNGKFGSANDVGPYTASVFYAIDRYHASFAMKRWLEQGKIIISNRYVSANLGHQGGKIKDKKERDKLISWIRDFEFNIMKIPKPDLNIFLHVPAEISQKLIDKKDARDYTDLKRDIHEEDLDHLKNSEDSYLRVCNSDSSWVKIDCVENNELLSIETISDKIFNVVTNLIENEKR